MAEKVKPFEKIFPYISYRWKYDDGEYSPYAPFTEVQFISKPVTDVKSRYEKGFNVFMVNDTENLVISNISKGREDVVAIDILYTESISSTVYILKTIELDPESRGNGYLDNIIIKKRSFGTALPDSELTRQFDAVPLKAKAQEFTANRLMYGNYLTKFNQGKNDLGGEGLQIKTGTTLVIDPKSGPSVKTNRTYDIGVVYMDKYGRQGSVLSQKTGENSSIIKTDFTYDSRIKLTAQITSLAPRWASWYKYYIKDVSTDFYNLTAFNIYLDAEGGDVNSNNVYLQFDSKDRNKVTEDSFLIPRRNKIIPDSPLSVLPWEGDVITENLRIPILDIENEAPDTVKAQVIERDVIGIGARFPDGNAVIIDKNVTNGAVNVASSSLTAVNDTSLAIYDEVKPNGWRPIISAINSYLASQDSNAIKFNQEQGDNTTTSQVVDVSAYSDRLALKIKPKKEGDQALFQTDLVLVETIEFLRFDTGSSNNAQRRNCFKFTLSNRVDEEGIVQSTTGLSKGGVNLQGTGPESDVILYKLGLSESGQDKLKGSFFVKVPRKTGGTNFDLIPTGQTTFNEDGEVEELKCFDFETEPGDDSNLNLYWESANAYYISFDELNQHGLVNTINWSNCIATVGGSNNKIYLESINIQDKFNSTQLVKGIRVNAPEANYAQERRKYGLIFSGLYNSRTGINELNSFNLTNGITKELEPNYGGIQKLYALDTNLLAFNEDKVFRILADKDALFNADDGVNVTATNLVLGQAMSYQGDYGISTHPESFAHFANNIYFTDAKRGVVMQLTPANGQLFPISNNGMNNFFRDRIGTADKLIGAYDGSKTMYVISMQGYDPNAASIGSETIPNETSDITLGYSLRGQYWTSRYSFIPETGLTLNNKFYTFKSGKIYLHNSDTAARNNFYGVQYNSEIEVIFNDNPTAISDWLSINYEGSSGWELVHMLADQEENVVRDVRIMDDLWFLKEGKFYGAIVGTVDALKIQPGSSPDANGLYPLIQDTGNTEIVSGVKGFFAKVRFKNANTTKKELFAISSEYYISQT